MAISKEAYGEQLDFLLRLNRDSMTTRMHMGYGGAVETAFNRLLMEAPPKKSRGSDTELWACVRKAKEAWFVRGVDLPFITTSIREQATQNVELFLHLAQENLTQKF